MIEPKTIRQIGPQLPSSMTQLNFGDQIREFAKLVDKRLGVVHRGVSIRLFTSVVMDTPVLTGMARGSWIPSMGGPAFGPTNPDPSGVNTIRNIQVTIKADSRQVSYLSSNLAYIVPLEYGWSTTKAPNGMVRINVARFQSILREEVAKAKKGTTDGSE